MLSFKKMCFLYRSYLLHSAHGISNVLKQLKVKYGIYTNVHLGKKDEISIWWSSTKSSEAGQKTSTITWHQKRCH